MKCNWKKSNQLSMSAETFSALTERVHAGKEVLQNSQARLEAAQMVLNNPESTEGQRNAAIQQLLMAYNEASAVVTGV